VGRILAGLANLQSEPHGDGVGPRRSEWCANLGNTNIAHPTIERGAIDGQIEKSWRLAIPRAAFDRDAGTP
jgi:hypothetical protein